MFPIRIIPEAVQATSHASDTWLQKEREHCYIESLIFKNLCSIYQNANSIIMESELWTVSMSVPGFDETEPKMMGQGVDTEQGFILVNPVKHVESAPESFNHIQFDRVTRIYFVYYHFSVGRWNKTSRKKIYLWWFYLITMYANLLALETLRSCMPISNLI